MTYSPYVHWTENTKSHARHAATTELSHDESSLPPLDTIIVTQLLSGNYHPDVNLVLPALNLLTTVTLHTE